MLINLSTRTFYPQQEMLLHASINNNVYKIKFEKGVNTLTNELIYQGKFGVVYKNKGNNKLGLSWAKLSNSWPKLMRSFDLISCLTGLDGTLHIS